MSNIDVQIPESLRPLSGGAPLLKTSGDTLELALRKLAYRHQILVQKILTQNGELQPRIQIFVNDRSASLTGGLATPLNAGDVVAVVQR